jgi:hypothetical protein
MITSEKSALPSYSPTPTGILAAASEAKYALIARVYLSTSLSAAVAISLAVYALRPA